MHISFFFLKTIGYFCLCSWVASCHAEWKFWLHGEQWGGDTLGETDATEEHREVRYVVKPFLEVQAQPHHQMKPASCTSDPSLYQVELPLSQHLPLLPFLTYRIMRNTLLWLKATKFSVIYYKAMDNSNS